MFYFIRVLLSLVVGGSGGSGVERTERNDNRRRSKIKVPLWANRKRARVVAGLWGVVAVCSGGVVVVDACAGWVGVCVSVKRV